MRNISDKFVEKIKQLFRKKVCLLDNVEKYGTVRQVTDDNIIRRMRFVCWIPKATDTHSEYVIFIAFSQQQWLHYVLRYTFTSCLICLFNHELRISENSLCNDIQYILK
jgi:hypothetical protein